MIKNLICIKISEINNFVAIGTRIYHIEEGNKDFRWSKQRIGIAEHCLTKTFNYF